MVEEVLSDEDEWYTLPELEPAVPAASTSDVEGSSDLDVLWLKFLSSPLLSSATGGTSASEETCNCKRFTKPHEQKQSESPETNFMFESIGESRNGLSLAEAFAAQHPQLVRRNRLSTAREQRNSSIKPELQQKPARLENQERRPSRSARVEEKLRPRPVRVEERSRPRPVRVEERPKAKPGNFEERLSKARERKNRIRTFQKEVLDQIREQSSNKHRPSK